MKYRIIKIEYNDIDKFYIVQKRLFFLPFWMPVKDIYGNPIVKRTLNEALIGFRYAIQEPEKTVVYTKDTY